MEGKVNYLVVGIFVALFITGAIGFAFWLMKYSSYEQPQHFVVYFDESVAGLSKDASVKYMGVDAGVVENIKVHPTDTQLVAVYLKLNHDIKIKTDMQATLKFYGMTGLAYVEISGHDTHAPLLVAKKGEIPVIKSSPSLFVKLDQILIDLSDKLSLTLGKVNRLVSDKNLQNIESTLANISDVTQELNNNREDITALIQQGGESITEITGTLKEFKTTSQSIKNLTKRINLSIRQGDYNLKEISDPMVQKISDMIENINDLSSKMQETVEAIEDSPSDLLFKHKTFKPGPGEN